MKAKPLVDSLTVKIAAGVTFLVLATLIPAGYLAATSHYQSQLALQRRSVRAQGELIRAGLEHDMLSKERGLIEQMVTRYGRFPGIKQVMVFDRWGRLRYASDRRSFERRFDRRSSPACQVCHAKPPGQRTTSVLIDVGEQQAIRHVIPLKNRARCHTCHNATHSINGVLIIDSTLDEARKSLSTDIYYLAGGVGVMALMLLAGTRLIIKRLVMNPLGHLEGTARAISEGDFSRRVSVAGTSGLARLGQGFNTMADSVSGLLSKLKRQREQLENVMNSVDDGLVVIDETLTITAINKAMARRFGATQGELLYKRCCGIRGDPSCSRLESGERCAAAVCFATGELQASFVTRHDAASDAPRQEEVFTSPVLDEDGRVVEVVEVWRDITERRSHEARMAEFHRLASLGMLASGFSHEVNTPLGTMLIHVEEIQRQADGDGELASQARLIRDEILRCRAITQQFLRLSKGQSLRQDLIELPGLIQATVPLMLHAAQQAGVAVRVDEVAAAPVVTANTGAVQQVLLNLLLNAVQASATGDEIRVGLRAGAEVVVEISDDGVGMTPEVRAKVFEPFFSRRATGTGLGLFVSLNMARQWDGDIRVTSAPGRGSTFALVFPRQGDP